jgi:hypothetical protein
MNSNEKRITYRPDPSQFKKIEAYANRHECSKNKAVTLMFQEKDEKIKELEQRVEKYRVHISKGETEKETPVSKSKEISTTPSEAPCSYMDYTPKKKPFCRNRKAPIDTRYLTVRACMLCQKLRKKILKVERKKRAEDPYKKGLAKAKNQTRNALKYIDRGKGFFTNEYGQRIYH